MAIVKGTKENFEAEVLKADGVVDGRNDLRRFV